ncbi:MULTISPECIES: hypothetical protein [unclassified Crossiella]|uniref:hypothetical protein n=1 Tax=unclassified Crossiella TaxID=2620835 RepID=UPI001FFE7804|nr:MULTISPECIES: hypothetical protein [unclassified Crossiella]MCK2238973.1 hypothetical protein [Crossiella sp. S99.2]MCK2251458.1 hypothetical protein [Crossiella sp. S99.1]
MASIAVEISDLRGWTQQNHRAAEDATALHRDSQTHMPKADFGGADRVLAGEVRSPSVWSGLAHHVRQEGPIKGET